MKFYKINEPDVSSESFDGEVLAINLKTGNYYSLRGTSAVFFRLIISGTSVDNIISQLSNFYSVPETTLLNDFTDFVKMLESNQLIKETSSYPNAQDTEWMNSILKEYKKPILECYTDMQDLLLIDPIHEVDVNAGWPNKLSDSETNNK